MLAAYLFLAPGFVLFALAILYPIGRALQISLYQWAIVPGIASDYVGLDNYRRAFDDPIFWKALVNTGFYMAATVPGADRARARRRRSARRAHARARPLPHPLLPARDHELGRCLAAVPLPLPHRRRPRQLDAHRRRPPCRPEHQLARRPLDGARRHQRARRLEGHRLVDGDLPRRVAGGSRRAPRGGRHGRRRTLGAGSAPSRSRRSGRWSRS